MILVGANDATGLRRPGEAAAYLGAAVRRLREAGVEVVVGTCPDLGAVRAIAPPLRQLVGWSGRRMARAQTAAVLDGRRRRWSTWPTETGAGVPGRRRHALPRRLPPLRRRLPGVGPRPAARPSRPRRPWPHGASRAVTSPAGRTTSAPSYRRVNVGSCRLSRPATPSSSPPPAPRSAGPSRGPCATSAPTTSPPPSSQAALDKVPQLDPHHIEDLYLGCGLPGGEQGFNMARVVATLLGLDSLPGATLTRYCASSLQTTRMAFHAIKAGEGDVFVSAGVEMVSRYARGNSDGLPPEAQALVGGGWQNPRFADGRGSARRAARRGRRRRVDRPARRTATLPDIYLDHGADRGEPGPGLRRHPRGHGRVRRTQPEPRREGHRRRLLGPRDHPGHHAGRHRGVAPTTARAPGVTLEAVAGLKPVFRPDGRITAGNCCPLNDGAAAVVVMSDAKAPRAGHHPAGPDRVHRRDRAVPGDHGPRPGRGVPAGAAAGPA